MISRSHKFAFVHIRKTAGTSIEVALADIAEKLNPRKRHMTALEYRKQLGRWRYFRLFKFTVVRNPWERLVSLYHFKAQMHALPPTLSFREWLLNYLPHHGSWRDRLSRFECVSNGRRLLVDYVARFERPTTDWPEICARIGTGQVRRLTHVKHYDRSAQREYRHYYDAQTRAFVERHYADDIAHFWYVFDGDASVGAFARSA